MPHVTKTYKDRRNSPKRNILRPRIQGSLKIDTLCQIFLGKRNKTKIFTTYAARAIGTRCLQNKLLTGKHTYLPMKMEHILFRNVDI